MKERSGYQPFEATIAEMTPDGVIKNELVQIDPELRAKISKGDPDPQFVTINVAVEGKSKNGRLYTRDTIQSICDQINENKPDGYDGHLRDDERPYKRPKTVTIWLGAAVHIKNGKAHLYATGYVMPSADDLRTYLQKSIAIGKNVSVSVYGKVKEAVYDTKEKALALKDFTLESIDWARSKSEGIPNDGTLYMTAAEMADENNDNPPKEDQVEERDKVIASLTADELRSKNPELVKNLTEGAKAEAKSEAGETVSEMEGTVKATGHETVAEMADELQELRVEKIVDNKVRAQSARPLIKSMVVSEMKNAEPGVTAEQVVDGVLASDEGKTIMEMHVDRAPRVNPMEPTPEATAERKHTQIIKRNTKEA